jgi:hypothetical protein
VKDIGDLIFFLGIEVIRDANGLYLSQRRYILDLLTRSQTDKAKSCLTPMSTSQSLTKSDGIPFADPHLYHNIVGGLQYLSFTRPDVAFAVHKVSKYMHNPLEPHWITVKCILRYLKSTISHALLIQPSTAVKLHCFSDADWASDRDGRRSIGAFCVYLGKNLISWGCNNSKPLHAVIVKQNTKLLPMLLLNFNGCKTC